MNLTINDIFDYLLLLVGVIALGAAGWFTLAPHTFPLTHQLRQIGVRLSLQGKRIIIGLLVLLVGVNVLLRHWRSGTDTTRSTLQPQTEQGTRTQPRTPPTNTAASFEAARDRLDHIDTPSRRAVVFGWKGLTYADADSDLEPVMRTLRKLAIDALATHNGRSREAAVEAVDSGTWTDDHEAAAFLAADTAVTFSRPQRLYAWLLPDRAFEARVDTTLQAINDICDDYLSHRATTGEPEP